MEWGSAMRLSYYGYCLLHVPSGARYLVDLRALVKKFVKSTSQQFKASVTYHGERLYLLPFGASTYLFIQTKTNEIIKAIEGKTLSVQDIRNKLLQNESVGFASYVYVDESYIGIATRVLSPRITAFCELISKVVAGYGGEEYAFIATTLAETLPSSAIHTLEHVGSVTVEMSVANSFAKDFLKQLTNRDANNLVDIASVEVTIKPLRKGKKSLRQDLAEISKNVPSKGLINLEARAKATAADHMTDIFIVGEGGIRDFIDFKKEVDLQNLIPERAAKNAALQVKVKEYKANASYKKVSDISTLGIDRLSPSAPITVPAQGTERKVGTGRRRSSKKTG
jgi:hypothetical protein